MALFIQTLVVLAQELLLFAAVGFFIIGIDEFLVDAIWLGQKLKFKRKPAHASPNHAIGKMAIFVPAWREAAVIGDMLRHTLAAWPSDQYQIFVGCYPNDPDTLRTVREVADEHISLVICDHVGPTTKGDCLNHIWRAMAREEKRGAHRFAAIVLHDAEDVVHPLELDCYARHIGQFAVVQLPVQPLIDQGSRWVSGHYIDEFSEAHGRDMLVRQRVGAALPLAGVGCAIRRDAMAAISQRRGGPPFDPESLTEDYELGLILGDLGYRGTFVREVDARDSTLIASKGHFPGSLETAIRQKTRWTLGIALLGWRRLGWRATLPEIWMRLRDRRTLVSAILLIAAYVGLVLALCASTALLAGPVPVRVTPAHLSQLFIANSFILFWRATVRAYFVARIHGPGEALRSIPRMVIASFIAIASVIRAVRQYEVILRTNQIIWEKTSHIFPARERH